MTQEHNLRRLENEVAIDASGYNCKARIMFFSFGADNKISW